MFNRMTALDQKWLIRIVLKRMNFGSKFSEQRIFSAYHSSAKDLYAAHAHLSKVCECIETGATTVDKVAVVPMLPFQPMLCHRNGFNMIETLLSKSEYYLETKMDGERFQIHLLDGKYKYFSRRGYEYEKSFGSSAIEGALTPYLHRSFKKPVVSIILDGEMMVWNKEELRYHSKGENYDVKALSFSDATLRPCFCAYDILFLNGTSLTNVPYGERKQLLHSLIEEREGMVTFTKPIKINNWLI